MSKKTVGEYINSHKDEDEEDVYDDYADDFGVAYCGSIRLTKEGLNKFKDVLDLKVDIAKEFVIVKVKNLHQHQLVKQLFEGMAGFVDEEEYDKLFYDPGDNDVK